MTAGDAVTPVVRFPFPRDDGTLTPYTFELGYQLVTLIYDTLLWRDPTGTPRPWLADSVDVSDDGLSLTLRLAPGARWHDGTPVTAADVAFTFHHVADHPHPRFTRQLDPVESVKALDDHTARIMLARPAPGFADQPLADLPILPAHLWQDLPDGVVAPEGLAVGSGPYRLVEHRPGEGYVLEASAGYFRGPPAVARLEVPILNQAEATLSALEDREVDMLAVSLPELAAERVDDLAIRVMEGTAYLGTALALNTRGPPFSDPDVRRAVSSALDLPRVARAVGDATPAEEGMIHPESPWAAPEPLHRFDEAAARDALEGISAPGGGPIPILAPDNDPTKQEAARQVALALVRAGAEAEAFHVPPDELDEALGRSSGEATFSAAIESTPPLVSYDPDFLRYLFGSDPAIGSFNTSGYASTAFDDLAEAIATTTDPRARRALVAEALGLVANEAPVVPLYFATGAFAFRPAIYDGWTFVTGVGILDKQSFVAPEPTPSRPIGDVLADAPDGGPSLLLPLAAAAGGLAVVLAVFALVATRRGT